MGKKHGKDQWDGEEERFNGQREHEGGQHDLSGYIRVAGPGTIVVAAALLILLVSMFVWGFVGTLPVTETVTGLVIDTAMYDSLYPEGAEQLFGLEAERLSRLGAERLSGSGKEPASEAEGEQNAGGEAEKVSAAPGETLSDAGGEIMVLCFVDASRYNGQAIKDFGDQATLRMPDQTVFTGTIETRFLAPVSREEAKTILFGNEWVLEKCAGSDYNWFLAIRPDEDISRYTYTLAGVTLLTEEVAPIRFLMR